MKKIGLFLLLLILLSSCASKQRAKFYNVQYKDIDLAVGYDEEDVVKDNINIDEYHVEEIKKKKIVTKAVIYINDNSPFIIDGEALTSGIKDSCEKYNGKYSDEVAESCVINKRVKNKDNYIVLYGDILDDDIDAIDRVEIYYEDTNEQ